MTLLSCNCLLDLSYFSLAHACPGSGTGVTYSACLCPSVYPAHPSACSLSFSVPCPVSCCMDKRVIVKTLSPPLFSIVFLYLWCTGWKPYCISGIQHCSSLCFQLALLYYLLLLSLLLLLFMIILRQLSFLTKKICLLWLTFTQEVWTPMPLLTHCLCNFPVAILISFWKFT